MTDHPRAYPYRIRKERLQRQWRIYQLSRFNKVRRLEEKLQRTTNPMVRGIIQMSIDMAIMASAPMFRLEAS